MNQYEREQYDQMMAENESLTKKKCDLHTNHQQEEPMHLTNNSDGLKPDTTFSASFVAGANPPHDLTMANNATMTFLHSFPQAISTPVRASPTPPPTSTTPPLLYSKIWPQQHPIVPAASKMS
uniref:Uncharacterized protein n=2 Tax=Ditylenchus dipsaci TaxID=166011 RepID=A0A915E9W4_9BILA